MGGGAKVPGSEERGVETGGFETEVAGVVVSEMQLQREVEVVLQILLSWSTGKHALCIGPCVLLSGCLKDSENGLWSCTVYCILR